MTKEITKKRMRKKKKKKKKKKKRLIKDFGLFIKQFYCIV